MWPTGRERSSRDIIIVSGPSPEKKSKNHERLLTSVLSLNESITFCFLSYPLFQSILFSQFLGKKSVLIKLTDILKYVLCWMTFSYVLLDDIRRCLFGRYSPMSYWTTFAYVLLDDIRQYLVGLHSPISCWATFADVFLGDIRRCLVGRHSPKSCWTTFVDVLLDDIRRSLVGRHSPMPCWTTFADVLLGDIRRCLVGRHSPMSCWTLSQSCEKRLIISSCQSVRASARNTSAGNE